MTDNKYAKPANRRRHMPRVATVLATLGIVLGFGGVAYAMDLGGVQEIVHVWIDGEETDATFNYENGKYSLEIEKEDGTTEHIYCLDDYGVANPPDVVYDDNGSVWFCYMDQKIEITDKFEDDMCYLEIEMEGETEYVTIKYQNGYSISPDGYIPVEDFN